MTKKTDESTALAVAATTPVQVEGMDNSDMNTPMAHLFQDIGKESDEFPGVVKGSLVNTGTKEVMHPAANPFVEYRTPTFMLITAYKEYIKYGPNQTDPPIYVHRDITKVPADELEWLNDKPPVAVEFIRWVVLFEGQGMPMVLTFKKRSLKVGKEIFSINRYREAQGMCAGAFTLGVFQDSNSLGKWFAFKTPKATDPESLDFINDAEKWKKGLGSAGTFVTEDVVASGDVDGPKDSDIPF